MISNREWALRMQAQAAKAYADARALQGWPGYEVHQADLQRKAARLAWWARQALT